MTRLFVAVHPPLAIATDLLATLDGLDLPDHRLTRPDQIHLTVLFVGEVDERDVPLVAESVERAAAGVRAFELAPDGWMALPERGPSRLIAAGAQAPSALAELHRRLAARLVVKGRKPRSFLPHLTLCRFTRPTPFELSAPFPGVAPFEIGEVSLMRSVLRPEGAEHRQVARFALAV
ncbi:RNA 2',3'-cyclic phosphodiesterase [Engelhardtia mirabilis]|uniref:RNA 2',3'-cyclic phosphodiesterase n=1 Tax=Engelhardtia mirabilis TaxID=2528011 RepID=UPI003AF3734D